MDWIAGNSLYKSSAYTRQQQQSIMHAVNIYNTQYRISYSVLLEEVMTLLNQSELKNSVI
jgi:hypothetical protein